jgi:uncharacterized protein (DUF1501 family)
MSAINRREFLKAAGAGVTFGATPLVSFGQAASSDFRALVCVYLFGGNDSFNMVIPRSTAEYNAYLASRQNMAVPRDSLLPVSPLNPDGSDYGLHPALPELQTLFGEGHAAFINNIGPLLRPVSKVQYLDRSVEIPPRLFSHNSQMDQWQTLQGLAASKTGWAGRIADLLRPGGSGGSFPANVSLHGDQLILTGNKTIPYIMGKNGPVSPSLYSALAYRQPLRSAYERILAAEHGSIYERGLADVQQRALQSVEAISSAVESAQPITVAFSDSNLGRQLHTVAKLISARDQLQMNRQIFFVGAGRFDTHDHQVEVQPQLFADLSKSLGDFYQATQDLGVSDVVTTFTESDFGRTLTSNGDGTDHGWGGIQMAVGGAVQGGKFYGVYPELSMGGPDEVSGGRLIPTTSADQYIATLSKWFGIPDADIGQIAPNIGNFAERDLGFL